MTNDHARHITAARLNALMLAILLLAALPSTAFGYTDPGTGAYVYQAVYAAFIGGVFYFRRFVTRFFRKREK